MVFLLEIISISFLSIIIFQDFKQRQISWILIPLLFILLSLISVQETGGIKTSLQLFLVNCVFIFFQLICLTVYFSIKERKLNNIINTYIGIGDVLFFIVLAAAFSPLNFIIFYVFSLILTVVGVLLLKLFKPFSLKEIPLAGTMSLALIICFIYKYFHHNFNFYDDYWAVKLFL